MDLKKSSFLLFLILASIFPLFFTLNRGEVQDLNITCKVLPDIEVSQGDFKEYSPNLVKKGNFDKISKYESDNLYFLENILFFTKDENSSFWNKIVTKKAEYKKDTLISKTRTNYYGKDYNLSADNVIYMSRLDKLSGNNFKLTGSSFVGTGSSFVYYNKVLKAKNIDYIIKEVNE